MEIRIVNHQTNSRWRGLGMLAGCTAIAVGGALLIRPSHRSPILRGAMGQSPAGQERGLPPISVADIQSIDVLLPQLPPASNGGHFRVGHASTRQPAALAPYNIRVVFKRKLTGVLRIYQRKIGIDTTPSIGTSYVSVASTHSGVFMPPAYGAGAGDVVKLYAKDAAGILYSQDIIIVSTSDNPNDIVQLDMKGEPNAAKLPKPTRGPGPRKID